MHSVTLYVLFLVNARQHDSSACIGKLFKESSNSGIFRDSEISEKPAMMEKATKYLVYTSPDNGCL